MNPSPSARPSNPFPHYARLRQETPIYWDRESGVWIVSRYHDVAAVLRDSCHFSAAILGEDSFAIRSPEDGAALPREETLLGSDSATHKRLRRRIAPLFKPEQVKEHEKLVRAALRELMDKIAPLGTCDVVEDIASPIASCVVTELLALPPHRRADVARWVKVCGQSNARSRPSWLEAAFDGVLGELWGAIRCSRGAEPHNLAAWSEVGADGAISAAQVLDTYATVLKGAADTTGHLTGNALMTLHANPWLTGELRSRPDLIAAFIEESLRHDAPVQMTVREVTIEVELSGVVLPAGARVLLLIGSANRDQAVFKHPDQFLLQRSSRKHLAFSGGSHQCPGAALARMQVRLILEALLQLPDLRVLAQSLRETTLSGLRGPERLLVAFTPLKPLD